MPNLLAAYSGSESEDDDTETDAKENALKMWLSEAMKDASAEGVKMTEPEKITDYLSSWLAHNMPNMLAPGWSRGKTDDEDAGPSFRTSKGGAMGSRSMSGAKSSAGARAYGKV